MVWSGERSGVGAVKMACKHTHSLSLRHSLLLPPSPAPPRTARTHVRTQRTTHPPLPKHPPPKKTTTPPKKPTPQQVDPLFDGLIAVDLEWCDPRLPSTRGRLKKAAEERGADAAAPAAKAGAGNVALLQVGRGLIGGPDDSWSGPGGFV